MASRKSKALKTSATDSFTVANQTITGSGTVASTSALAYNWDYQVQSGQRLVFGNDGTGTLRIGGWDSMVTKIAPAPERTIPCHEKMEGKDRPWVEALRPHWERAKKLGLQGEVDAVEKMILAKDIHELTKGAGYPEVTDRDLEAMFQFPRLRRKVRWHNFKANFVPGRESITLRLKKDGVSRPGVAIPYGAMLRLEEAKETGFFQDFKVVYPNVVTESELARERARERDPALVGVYNDAMFLICSWDLPQDVEKAEADVDGLLQLKLKD